MRTNPRLFYTWSDGADLQLTSWEFYKGTPRHCLFQRGEEILSQYVKLVENNYGGSLRLQNAFAAACEDVSQTALALLTENELAELRSRWNWRFSARCVPLLVVYLGGGRSSDMGAPGSIRGTLTYAAIEEVELDDTPWSKCWDAAEGPWPCTWGYHVRGRTKRSQYIFLSGAYVAWPARWQDLGFLERDTQLNKLNAHLGVTIFRELTRVAQTQMEGRAKLTPQKAIDNLKLAEVLAFGSVVDLYISRRNTLNIFATDTRSPASLDFELKADVVRKLFNDLSPTPPIDLAALSTTQRPLVNIPQYARTGAPCPAIELDTPEEALDSFHSIRPPRVVDNSSLRLITGELAETLGKKRPETIKMKRCIESW
ncbi:hypothetical protein DFH09DRAFT_1373227 [Mycena vulgaris]|nr:hypothetical protein DFH09DRAFT_1373227 [Mycena vulgaris]